MPSSKFRSDLRNAFFRNTPAFSRPAGTRPELQLGRLIRQKLAHRKQPQVVMRPTFSRGRQLFALAGAVVGTALAAGSVILVGASPATLVIGEAQPGPVDPNKAGGTGGPHANPTNGQPSAPPQGVATAGLLDFQFDADGRPLTLDTIIDGRFWSKLGVVVSTDLLQATFSCRDAAGQAIRISRPGLTDRNPVSGAGVYLTSSFPSEITRCNSVPLRLDFAKPLTAANVVFTGLPTVNYTATFYFSNGQSQSLEASCRAIGEECAIGLKVPDGGSPIKTIVFGHSRNVPESTTSITMLKKIGLTEVR